MSLTQPSAPIATAPEPSALPLPHDAARGSGKTLSLEGLRGLAAFTVILSHCVFGFYPFLHEGAATQLQAPWEPVILNSPFCALYNGTFSVCVFFVMSGYVLTRKFFAQGEVEPLQEAAVKRYLRLAPPVLGSVLFGYVLLKAGLFPAGKSDLGPFLAGAYQHEASLLAATKEGLYRALILGEAQYNYVLWTIQAEFIGSIALFAFLALFGRFRGSGWLAAATSLILIKQFPVNGLCVAMFFVGAYMHRWPDIGRRPVLLAVAVLAGLYLGGYHWNSASYTHLVTLANWLQARGKTAEWPLFFPALGAVLLVWGIVRENAVSRFLSLRPLVWLGDKSFAIYLLHSAVLSSLGVFVYMGLPTHLSYLTRASAASLSVIAGTLLVAIPFARFVDARSVRLSTWFGKLAMGQLQAFPGTGAAKRASQR
ncbi:acyltransferase [Myxococcaceae bacterium JPH2]|nr:acyltransferase [Myxococcaceae bacterium JPH2]